jgi:uncharacterized membrane protein
MSDGQFEGGQDRGVRWALAPCVVALFALAASARPAAADFRLCNNTMSRVGVAIGYKDAKGWTTEGWWNLPSNTCETILKGNLVARYYYVYAVDYDRGGEWLGHAYMCTRDKEFTIRGIKDCLARGYDRTGFFEVDTGDQRAWTVQLTESGEQRPALSRGNPARGMPGPEAMPSATAPTSSTPTSSAPASGPASAPTLSAPAASAPAITAPDEAPGPQK